MRFSSVLQGCCIVVPTVIKLLSGKVQLAWVYFQVI